MHCPDSANIQTHCQMVLSMAVEARDVYAAFLDLDWIMGTVLLCEISVDFGVLRGCWLRAMVDLVA